MTIQTLNSGSVTPPVTPPTITPQRTPWLRGKTAQEWLSGFGFIIPALIILGLFVLIPMIFALVISFTNWTGIQPPNEAVGVGLDNYKSLLTDDGFFRSDFFEAIKNTLYYVIGVVPIQTILSLLLAMIVNQKFLKGKGLFRTTFYFPSITSSIVISLIFLFLFSRQGIINDLLTSITGGNYRPVTWTADPNGVIHNFLGLFGIKLRTLPEWMTVKTIFGASIWDWISGPSVSMLAIMFLTIWTTAGTLMIIFLAALQDIPAQLYEAASVDGATRWQQFRNITLPLLRPTTFFVITIGLIGTLQVFDQVYVISAGKGDPAGTTKTIALIVYRNAFNDSSAGLGAATAIMLFVIIILFTLVQRRLWARRKERRLLVATTTTALSPLSGSTASRQDSPMRPVLLGARRSWSTSC